MIIKEEKLKQIGSKLAQMKSLKLAFDSIAEDLSFELNIPIWRIHNTFENVYQSIVPEEGNITVATKFVSKESEDD